MNSRPFGIPALFSLQTLQQVVMTSGSVGGLPTVVTMAPGQSLTTLSSMPQSSLPPTITSISLSQPPPRPTAQLYLCTTSNNATEPPSEEGEGGKEKASLELLQHDYNDLNSRKIKDSLSSFLPDIPGDFDSVGTTNTMLKNLLEQRTIGNREFLPLSGQALLGFRLLPGALPEQYRIDPPSMESKHHHKRKKHKRKQIEKMVEDNGDLGPPPPKAKMPSDAFTFIKQETSHSHYPSSQPGHPYGFHGSQTSQATSVIQQTSKPVSGHTLGQPLGGGSSDSVAMPYGYTATAAGVGHPFPGEKRKKKKKENKEKKKEKKEKKKKREKHHPQDPSGPGAPPPGGGAGGTTLQPHPQVSYGSFPHT